jgi:hypothetical protein
MQARLTVSGERTEPSMASAWNERKKAGAPEPAGLRFDDPFYHADVTSLARRVDVIDDPGDDRTPLGLQRRTS